MEFLVEFETNLPAGTSQAELSGSEYSEASANLRRVVLALPMYGWMHVTVTSLQPLRDDPARRVPR